MTCSITNYQAYPRSLYCTQQFGSIIFFANLAPFWLFLTKLFFLTYFSSSSTEVEVTPKCQHNFFAILATFWLFLTKFYFLFCFSSSSTAAEVTPIWQQQLQQPPQLRNGVQASSIQHLGKEYSRLEGALNQPDTLFSSEGSSSASEAGEYSSNKITKM